MAVSGKNARILYGHVDISPYFHSIQMRGEAGLHECTTFGDDHRDYITGFRGGSLVLNGYWDQPIETILQDAFGSENEGIVTYAPIGFGLGAPVNVIAARQTTHNTTQPVDGVTAISADIQSTRGALDSGISLHALALEIETGAGAVHDRGAATANGGVGHLHVTSVDGAGADIDVLIEHAITGSGDWATLATFAGVTAPISERLVVPKGTIVNRRLRASWTVSGTDPELVFAVVFARR